VSTVEFNRGGQMNFVKELNSAVKGWNKTALKYPEIVYDVNFADVRSRRQSQWIYLC